MRDAHAYAAMPIDALYRWFAGEADPTSPTWGALCRWIADTPALLARLDSLPGRKRQPNLFLAAVKYLGGPVIGGAGFLAWVDGHWSALEETILARATQTNEPGRCAVLAPVLASYPQPLHLIELGASAGLCLLPDRYAYELGDGVHRPENAGPRAPVFTCSVTGTLPASPSGLRIAGRAGLDRNPLDPTDPDDVRWLRALVWPGDDAREEGLAAALAVAAADPPAVRAGTLPQDLPAFLAEGRAAARAWGATPVVVHSATLAYLARPERDAVAAALRGAGVGWVSLEGPTVMTDWKKAPVAGERPHFLISRDGEVLGRCSPHGGWVEWHSAG